MENIIVCYDGTTMILKDVLTGEYQICPCTTLSAVNLSEAPYIDTGTSSTVVVTQGAGASICTI